MVQVLGCFRWSGCQLLAKGEPGEVSMNSRRLPDLTVLMLTDPRNKDHSTLFKKIAQKQDSIEPVLKKV